MRLGEIYVRAAAWIGAGIVAINLALLWWQTEVLISWDVFVIALPVVCFSFTSMWFCWGISALIGPRAALPGAVVLVVLHFGLLGYLCRGWLVWPEGQEYAEGFVIHVLYVLLVLFFGVVRPLIQKRIA